MIIAIDGPSGAGKSTVSREVADRLQFACLDTGAMYRSIAVVALDKNIDLEDNEKLGEVARTNEIEFRCAPGEKTPRLVFIDGKDVTSEIRTARIDRVVSKVSAAVPVREALLDQQRRIGLAGNYVVEGRDIGTVVFPEAEVKVFLTASNEERARRRVLQNKERGIGSVDFDEVLEDIVRRDELDSSRAAAPLRAADDAVRVDSSNLTQEEVIQTICDLAHKCME